MRNILKCARLEIITFKPYLRSMLLMPALGAVMALAMSSPGVLGFYLLFGVMMTAAYPFNMTESSRLDFLRASLPISKKDEVLGRYAFILFFGLMALAAGILIVSLIQLFLPNGSSFLGTAFTLTAAFAAMLLMVALQYPLFYRFGYAKAKNFVAAPMIILLIICIQLPNILQSLGVSPNFGSILNGGGNTKAALLLLVLIAATALIYFGSARLSVRLREKYVDV